LRLTMDQPRDGGKGTSNDGNVARKFFFWHENCRRPGLGGLWALEWAWHIRVTNLRCAQGYDTYL